MPSEAGTPAVLISVSGFIMPALGTPQSRRPHRGLTAHTGPSQLTPVWPVLSRCRLPSDKAAAAIRCIPGLDVSHLATMQDLPTVFTPEPQGPMGHALSITGVDLSGSPTGLRLRLDLPGLSQNLWSRPWPTQPPKQTRSASNVREKRGRGVSETDSAVQRGDRPTAAWSHRLKTKERARVNEYMEVPGSTGETPRVTTDKGTTDKGLPIPLRRITEVDRPKDRVGPASNTCIY